MRHAAPWRTRGAILGKPEQQLEICGKRGRLRLGGGDDEEHPVAQLAQARNGQRSGATGDDEGIERTSGHADQLVGARQLRGQAAEIGALSHGC